MLCKLLTQRISNRNLYSNLHTVITTPIRFIFSTPELYQPSPTDHKLDEETVKLLEKLSLVNFENQQHVAVVEEAIAFANGINSIATDNVEPMVSVLEDRNLKLREDVVTDGNCRQKILQNAALLEEEYFVAPPGMQISENYLYLTPVLSGSVISHFRYGPLGELLQQNICNEWVFSNVTCRDTNVFPFSRMNSDVSLIEGVKDHYCKVKSIFGGSFPFSLAYSRIPTILKEDDILERNESKYFRPRNCSAMKCVTFTVAEDGLRFFHYWLRQRKIWWRKFSANPSKFSLTNIDSQTENVEFAHIKAEFPWGVECIETVKYFSSSSFESFPEDEQKLWLEKAGKKKVFPCIVESVTNLETAIFTFLCDAYLEDIRLDTGLPHQVMKLHRKLAPYKVAVVIDVKKNDDKEDLMYLAEYVSLNLRKSGIATFMLQHDTKKTLEEQFKFYDMLAVPYVVILEPSTLNDGLFGLRSRETTLQERLHITNLTDHVNLSLKNY